jgi:hypothetical protein
MGELDATCTAPALAPARAPVPVVDGGEMQPPSRDGAPELEAPRRLGGGGGDAASHPPGRRRVVVVFPDAQRARLRGVGLSLTPGCHSIGYKEHTGCHKLNRVLAAK